MLSCQGRIRTLLISVCLGGLVNTNCVAQTIDASKNEKLPLADLQRFSKVVEYIKEYYVSPVSDEVLFENAMRGMLAGLDPHSNYFDAEEFSELKTNTSGKFGGLGVEVFPEDGYIRVISPIDGSPAERAGVQAGDLIIRLNDTPIKGLTPREAIELMRGEKGSKIRLTIVRESEPKPVVLEVTRDTIHMQSIRTKLLDPQHAYIRIGQFQNNSGDDLKQALKNLQKNNSLKGIILDLRNNLGGVFESAVQIADIFLDRAKLTRYDGAIVSAKGRLANMEIMEKAHNGDLLNGAPMIVLINAGTASCSEIVAGALQDYRRALIVGTKSFGKGSMQTVFPLKDNRGLKLTTQLYYTPAGRSIQATGIQPDIVVANKAIPLPKEENAEDMNPLLVREQNLLRHIENDDSSKQKQTATQAQSNKNTPTENSNANLFYTDYQLYEGYNLLKALTTVQAS